MNVGAYRGSRPQWFDRAPSSGSLGYEAAGVAPHGQTVRGTYTVPAGRRAIIENQFILIQRATAAAAVGGALAAIEVALDGSTFFKLNYADLSDNTVRALKKEQSDSQIFLAAGAVLRIWTLDGSTGGTVVYNLFVKITEYDA